MLPQHETALNLLSLPGGYRASSREGFASLSGLSDEAALALLGLGLDIEPLMEIRGPLGMEGAGFPSWGFSGYAEPIAFDEHVGWAISGFERLPLHEQARMAALERARHSHSGDAPPADGRMNPLGWLRRKLSEGAAAFAGARGHESEILLDWLSRESASPEPKISPELAAARLAELRVREAALAGAEDPRAEPAGSPEPIEAKAAPKAFEDAPR